MGSDVRTTREKCGKTRRIEFYCDVLHCLHCWGVWGAFDSFLSRNSSFPFHRLNPVFNFIERMRRWKGGRGGGGGWKTSGVDGKHKMTGDTNECGYNCCASVCCVCFGSHNNKSIIHGEYFAELAAAWLGLHYDSLSVKHMAKKEDGQKTKKKNHTTKKGIHI